MKRIVFLAIISFCRTISGHVNEALLGEVINSFARDLVTSIYFTSASSGSVVGVGCAALCLYVSHSGQALDSRETPHLLVTSVIPNVGDGRCLFEQVVSPVIRAEDLLWPYAILDISLKSPSLLIGLEECLLRYLIVSIVAKEERRLSVIYSLLTVLCLAKRQRVLFWDIPGFVRQVRPRNSGSPYGSTASIASGPSLGRSPLSMTSGKAAPTYLTEAELVRSSCVRHGKELRVNPGLNDLFFKAEEHRLEARDAFLRACWHYHKIICTSCVDRQCKLFYGQIATCADLLVGTRQARAINKQKALLDVPNLFVGPCSGFRTTFLA